MRVGGGEDIRKSIGNHYMAYQISPNISFSTTIVSLSQCLIYSYVFLIILVNLQTSYTLSIRLSMQSKD